MLQARENTISLRKWSGGTTQLRTLEGILLMIKNVHTRWTSDEIGIIDHKL